MWFDSWSDVLRTVVVGALAYAAIVLLLRVSGNRTLAKLSAFDMIVTVALGSVLATLLLNTSVALFRGLVAFCLLVGLQFLVAALAARYRWVSKLVTAEPVLLLHHGHFLDGAMRRQRVTRSDIMAALRSSGVAAPDKVAAVVIEAHGSMNVIGDVGPDGMIETMPGLAGA